MQTCVLHGVQNVLQSVSNAVCITVCRSAVTCQDERGASALRAWEFSQALLVTYPTPSRRRRSASRRHS